jgi:hypothetical protein
MEHHIFVTQGKANELRRELEHSEWRKNEDTHRFTRDLHQLRLHYDNATNLLRSRTLELEGAQAFLTKADLLSGAEVIAMVETLNAEIFQVTSVVADSYGFEERIAAREELNGTKKPPRHVLGQKMVQLLKSTRGEDLVTVVQIALQSCMVTYCAEVVRPGYFGYPEYEYFLRDMYDGIAQDGETRTFF